MAINDYQQYAGGSGANVESQAGYLSDSTLPIGSVTGVLPSTRFNKICRQATMASAALGKIIADFGVNVYDDGNISNFASQLLAALTAAIGGANASPIGTIIQFAGASPPANYISCPTNNITRAYPDGNLVSRTVYASLFSVLGETWGAGDGSTTFGLPYFPSGYAPTAGDPGSVTVGQVISHHHTYQIASSSQPQSGSSTECFTSNSTSVTGFTGGSANLAAGTNLLFCVKYQ